MQLHIWTIMLGQKQKKNCSIVLVMPKNNTSCPLEVKKVKYCFTLEKN